MMKLTRPILATAMLLVTVGALMPPAAAQQYPDRPVRIVLGFPAGSGPDLIARLVADELQQAWDTGVAVDNKPGAAGQIAAQEVAKTAAADGYTLLLGEVGQLSMAPSTYARLAYDPAEDLAPISHIASADFALVVPESVPANNLAAYIDWAKQQDRLFMGTFGAGTPGHFGASIFGNITDVKVEPIHYKTTGDAMSGVLRGDVQGLFGSVALVAPQVKAGKLRALATTGPERSPVLPDVPTATELGRPSLEFSAWFGLLAPAGTPPEVLDKISTTVVQAVQSSEARQKLADAGFRVTGTGREAFQQLMREETARWAKVVEDTGFQALQ